MRERERGRKRVRERVREREREHESRPCGILVSKLPGHPLPQSHGSYVRGKLVGVCVFHESALVCV